MLTFLRRTIIGILLLTLLLMGGAAFIYFRPNLVIPSVIAQLERQLDCETNLADLDLYEFDLSGFVSFSIDELQLEKCSTVSAERLSATGTLVFSQLVTERQVVIKDLLISDAAVTIDLSKDSKEKDPNETEDKTNDSDTSGEGAFSLRIEQPVVKGIELALVLDGGDRILFDDLHLQTDVLEPGTLMEIALSGTADASFGTQVSASVGETEATVTLTPAQQGRQGFKSVTVVADGNNFTVDSPATDLESKTLTIEYTLESAGSRHELSASGPVVVVSTGRDPLQSPQCEAKFTQTASEQTSDDALATLEANLECDRLQGLLEAQTPELRADVKGTSTAKGLRIEFAKVSIDAEDVDSNLTAQGAYSFGDTTKSQTITLEASPLNLSLLSAVLQPALPPLNGTVDGITKVEKAADGGIHLTMAQPLVASEVQVDGVAPFSTEIMLSAHYDQNAVTLSNLDLQITRAGTELASLSVDGTIYTQGAKTSQLELTSEHLQPLVVADLAKELRTAFSKPNEGKKLKEPSSQSAKTEETPLRPIEITFELQDVALKEQHFDSMRGRLSWKQDAIALSSGEVTIDQTEFAIEGTVDLAASPPSYQGVITGEDLQLTALSQLANTDAQSTETESDALSGTVTETTLTFQGSGFDRQTLERNLTADFSADFAQLSIPHGTADQFPVNIIVLPLRVISDLVTVIPNNVLPPGLSTIQNVVFGSVSEGSRTLNFASADVDLSVAEGEVKIEEARFNSRALPDVSIEGEVGLDKELNVVAGLHYGGAKLPLPIGGTTNSPVPDIPKFVQELTMELGLAAINVPAHFLQRAYAAGIKQPLKLLTNPVKTLTNPVESALSPFKALFTDEALDEAREEVVAKPVVTDN